RSAMLKKISVDQLKPGMYVTNISDRGISLHEHEREGRIKDQKTILALSKRGVRELYIDTKQGDDSPHAIAIEESDKQLKGKLEDIATEQKPRAKEVSFEQEFEKASQMHHEAINMVSNAMEAAKTGNIVDLDNIENMAENFMDSVERNQNALACLSRIREKDSYLMEHSVNVAVLMSILGKYLQLERVYLHQCVTGALLHDIGKVLIPDTILHKPGKLTHDEFAIMRRHASYSKRILQKNHGFPQVSINVAGQHHERLDGKGYPDGLQGDAISQEARMASVVDIYDAITADRVYHKGMPPSVALKRMLEWSGPHLDTKYVHAFIKAIGVYPVGSLVELSNGLAGIVIKENPGSIKPIIKVMYNVKQNIYAQVTTLDLSLKTCGEHIIRSLNPQDFGIKVEDFIL
ncbi:MAG: HD-GYP domain-containing protein, partial [Bermanella sp.]